MKINITIFFTCRNGKPNSEAHMESQGTLHSQNNLDKKQSRKTTLPNSMTHHKVSGMKERDTGIMIPIYTNRVELEVQEKKFLHFCMCKKAKSFQQVKKSLQQLVQ